jgi:hypothetical protein
MTKIDNFIAHLSLLHPLFQLFFRVFISISSSPTQPTSATMDVAHEDDTDATTTTTTTSTTTQHQFTVMDIVAKAEEFVATCNYQMADRFYQRALECVPDTVPIMEDYSNLLLEMQEIERAIEVRHRVSTFDLTVFFCL